MKIDRQNYEFDASPTEELLKRIKPHEKVLYTNCVPVLLYLTNGLHPYGAVLYSAIRGTPEEAPWLSDDRLRYVVARSPIAVSPTYDLRVDDSRPLYVGFGELLAAESPVMELSSPEGPATVEIAVTYEGTVGDSQQGRYATEYNIRRGTRETVELASPSGRERFGSIQLSLISGAGPVIVDSIRRGAEASLKWIWDEGMYVRYSRPNAHETVVRFDSSMLGPPSLQPLEVIGDRGFSVLAERIR